MKIENCLFSRLRERTYLQKRPVSEREQIFSRRGN